MTARGHFVVVEGGDGAGKTTLIAELVRGLALQGHTSVLTAEPTAGPIGEELRRMLDSAESMPGAAELALLFAADRAMHLRAVIHPALARGATVVCSRYVLSSLAYQGPAAGLRWVAELNRHALAPDLLLYLDVPPDVGVARVTAFRAPDAFQTPARAHAAAEGYAAGLALLEAQGQRVARLDATLPLSVLAEQALALVLSLSGGGH